MEFRKEDILSVDLNDLVPVISTGYRERFSKKEGEHYKFLRYISNKFNNINILDIGTRAGASAICLADNRTNKVTTIDFTDIHLKEHKFDFSSYPNIQFLTGDIQEYDNTFYKKFQLICLDIDHTGVVENRILRKLEKSFSGILIMDDIDMNRFSRLREVWNSITRKKLIIKCAHHSGTGVVSYGTDISYKEN